MSGLVELSYSYILFASAGGGGSGGGGSSGGVGYGLILIGYLPMFILGDYFRKREKVDTGNFITWPVAIIYSILLIAIFKGYGFIMAIGAVLGTGSGLYGWLSKLRRNKNAENKLQVASSTDASWKKNTLEPFTKQVFERFQYDWSRNDIEPMKNYLTPRYLQHIQLMILALTQASRVNRMSNVEVTYQNIQTVNDASDNNQDSFVMGFEASATDELLDTRTNSSIYTRKASFIEFWQFVKSGQTWLLDGITPATANLGSENSTIKQFAERSSLYYSLDWGWLLLPQRGQIFNKGKFGVSDINNHVIGMYNNHLIQIYTFCPNPANKPNDQYLIAQMILPKSYGDIVVRHKLGFFANLLRVNVKGLKKIETEWPDFNKKYEVYASMGEGATSFELLHPAFMEVLEAQGFEINLEVVDNMVYFYSLPKKLQPENYPKFLTILQEAFKQMRL